MDARRRDRVPHRREAPDTDAGSWLVIPGGVVHSLKTLSESASYLMFSEPAGVEDLIAEVHEKTANDPTNLEKIIQIAGKHGIEPVLG